MRPAISVLIATHNRPEMLNQCLDSLKNQTFKDFEVVVVNDGGCDLDINVDKYVKIDKSGIAAARNIAMDIATGIFFFIMDDDDYLEPTCLEEEYNLIIRERADAVFCELNMFDGDRQLGLFGTKVQSFEEMVKDKKMPHPSFMFRSSTCKSRYDEQFQSAVDLDFTLNYLSTPRKIVKLDKALYNYRWHIDNESHKERQIENRTKIIKKYEDISKSTQ